ncbi:MAG: glycoside hydrolase family 2 protein, partial [Pseudomonadota bacterium]
NSFENFVYLSQVQQGLAIKTAVTHWRSLKPHCMGTLIWQLNDTWPVCSWASLDHGGGWKLLHHMAKEFYQPVFVSAVPVGGQVELRAVNDTGAPVALTVTAHAAAMDGTTRPLGSATVTVGDQAQLALAVAVPEGEILTYTWAVDGHQGGDHFAPKPYKSYDLHPASLAYDVKPVGPAYEITVTSKALALFVALEADHPGRFSSNGFALFPGHPATVTFTPKTPGPAPQFTLRDLHAATT